MASLNRPALGARDTRLLDLRVVEELRAYVDEAPENGPLLLTGSAQARAIILDAAPSDKALRNALVCLLDPELRAGHTLQSATATARSLTVLSSRLELSQGIAGSIAERAVNVMAAVFGTGQPPELITEAATDPAADPAPNEDSQVDAPPPPESDRIERPRRARPPPRRGVVFRHRVFGLAALGAVLVTASFTVLDWFRHSTDENLGSWRFSHVRALLGRLDGFDAVRTPARLYFSWLAWVLLAVAVATVVVASLSTHGARAFRVVGPAIAVVGIAMTFWSLEILTGSDPGYRDYISHADLGFWCAVAGFTIIGVTAAIAKPPSVGRDVASHERRTRRADALGR